MGALTETGGYAYWWVYASTWDKLIAVPVTFEGGGAEFDNPWSLGEIEIDMKAYHLVEPVEPPHGDRDARQNELVCHNCGATVMFRQDLSYGLNVGCECRAFNVEPVNGQGVKEHYTLPGGISWEHDPEKWRPYWRRQGNTEDDDE